jgi:hypothetical protein
MGDNYSVLIPLYTDDVDEYLAVLRDVDSLNINTLVINIETMQFRVDFTAAVPLPGFNIVSERLTPADKGDLIQSVLDEYWGNRVVPVGDSSAFFKEDHLFGLNRSAAAGGTFWFDPYSCKMIMVGVAGVCRGGGFPETIVPLVMDPFVYGRSMALVFIYRDIQRVEMFVGHLNTRSEVQLRTMQIPDSVKNLLPSLTFESNSASVLNRGFVTRLFWKELRNIWDGNFERLTVLERPSLEASGEAFQYSYISSVGGGVSYVPLSAEDSFRVGKALTVVRFDPLVSRIVVPLIITDVLSFATISRRDDGSIDLIRFSLGGVMSALTVLPVVPAVVQTPPLVLSDASVIDVDHMVSFFGKPLFDYWTKKLYINPHNVFAREAALCMAFHRRLGVASPMRLLKDEVMKLCIGNSTVPNK